ncbi:hypothetical protein [Pseudomonas soli]|jgi:hypothetical protein|uniref:Uncharacterized protein n=1 Tax=Pseudomonas soli TaxID=1306993 RepID=A0A2V4HAS7_9PSED|nr:hypothetical protein [Pseudomonas soli]PYB74541.1 hypothetical protein DMX07_24450 [Pseudomonas soli]
MKLVSIAFVLVNTVFVLALPVSFVVQWGIRGAKGAGVAQRMKSELSTLREVATVSDWMALLIFVNFLVFMVLTLIVQYLHYNPVLWMAYALLLTMVLAMLVLCRVEKEIWAELKKYRALLMVAIGLTSAAIPYLAGPLADATISRFTGMEANAFVRGQNLFVLIMSVVVWPLGLLPLGALVSWLLGTGHLWAVKRKVMRARLMYLSPRQRLLESRRLRLATARRISVLIALSFTTAGMQQTTSRLVSTSYASQKLKQALVFSSFHLPPEACGLEDQVPASAKLVQVRFRLAVVAVPNGTEDYRFIKRPCRINELAARAAAHAP